MKKDKLSKGAKEVAAARARIRTYSPAKKKALERGAMQLINGGDAAKRCMKGLRRKLKKAMAEVDTKNKKVARKRRAPTPAELLNDIHEGIPVSMKEALSVIAYLEELLEKKDCARTQQILDALEKMRMPQKPEMSDEQRRLYEKAMKRRPAPPERIPYFNLPPIVIQPWDPRYPFKPVCSTGDAEPLQYATAPQSIC